MGTLLVVAGKHIHYTVRDVEEMEPADVRVPTLALLGDDLPHRAG
jgi:hypothetical protein